MPGCKPTKKVSIVRSGCVVDEIHSEFKPVVYGHLATNEFATKKSDFLVAMWWRVDNNNSATTDTVYLLGMVTSASNQNISLSILIDTLRRTSDI